MNQIIANLKGLGRKRLMILAATGIGLTAALLIGFVVAMSPTYRPLAMDVTAAEASTMVTSLEQAGYRPRVSPDGTMISLPEGDIARARMTLAEAGLPATGSAGWELFDNASGIGMNSFLQRVNRLRALEGELSRSIMTLDAVEMARVHLVLPERETFSQERPEPTASIIVKTRRGLPMERRQALAVRNLVAAAVPGLAPERVTVLSNSGDTILGSEDSGTGAGLALTRASLEDRYARNVEAILGARVGAGNVRVRVAADIATSREVVVTEAFDPDQQVARRVENLAEQSNGREGGQGSVDVANNMPGTANGAGAGTTRSESRSKTHDTTDYEIGNTRSERVTEAGGIRRLTVAVLVNGTTVDGTYTDRDQAELDQLTALVRSAIGYDEGRGDEVTVESLQFIEDAGFFAEGEGSGIADALIQNTGSIIRGVIALLAIALLLTLGLPYLRRLGAAEDKEAAEIAGNAGRVADGTAARTDGAGAAVPAGVSTAAVQPGDEGAPAEGEGSEFVALPAFSGEIKRRSLEDLVALVDANPEESLRVVRAWINQKA